jgi:hypothetical protein
MSERHTAAAADEGVAKKEIVATTYNNDISGLTNINEHYESSSTKKWIKLIPIDKTIAFETYNRKDHFIPIAGKQMIFLSFSKTFTKFPVFQIYSSISNTLQRRIFFIVMFFIYFTFNAD